MEFRKEENKLIIEIEQGKELREFDRFFQFRSVRGKIIDSIKNHAMSHVDEHTGIEKMADEIDDNICKFFPEIKDL